MAHFKTKSTLFSILIGLFGFVIAAPSICPSITITSSNQRLTNCTVNDTLVKDKKIIHKTFNKVIFQDNIFYNLEFYNNDFRYTNFVNFQAKKIVFSKGSIDNATFEGASFAGIDAKTKNKFEKVKINNTSFKAAYLSAITFVDCVIDKVNFSKALILLGEFKDLTVRNSNLSGATIRGANLSNVKFVNLLTDKDTLIESTVFSHVDLSGVKFAHGMNFKHLLASSNLDFNIVKDTSFSGVNFNSVVLPLKTNGNVTFGSTHMEKSKLYLCDKPRCDQTLSNSKKISFKQFIDTNSQLLLVSNATYDFTEAVFDGTSFELSILKNIDFRSTLFKKTDKKINFDGADLSKSKFNMNWDNFTQTAQFSFSTNFSEVRFNDRVCPKLSKGGCNPVVHSNSLKLFWGNESN